MIAYDVRAMKKSCVHIAQPDGKLIPFESFNLFYREPAQRRRLAELRREARAPFVEREVSHSPEDASL